MIFLRVQSEHDVLFCKKNNRRDCFADGIYRARVLLNGAAAI